MGRLTKDGPLINGRHSVKQSIVKMLERITNGRLILNVKATSEKLEFGDASATAVVLTILDEEKFWSRLGTEGDMGFANSYLLEEVKGDLYDSLRLVMKTTC
jgi:hypothetical protein